MLIFNSSLNLRKSLSEFILKNEDESFLINSSNLTINLKNKNLNNVNKLPRCDLISQKLIGYKSYNKTELEKKINETFVENILKNQNITYGGKWEPSYCKSRYHVAILIPYLNREHHLNHFLLNMHPIFARQELSYGIYVIEPVANITFNRGLLLNAGFIESNKDSNNKWQCHSFHDVDMISEDDRTLYSCPDSPTHLSHRISKNNYNPLYSTYFGGITLIPKNVYEKANGYSNLFFGWGGEDDDHYYRVIKKGFKILFPPEPYGRYLMMGHDPDNPNPERFKLMKEGTKVVDIHGLNTVKYKLIKTEKKQLYTKFLVYYEKQNILNNNNTSKT